MPLHGHIWLLLCYANWSRSNLVDEFQELVSPERIQSGLHVLPYALRETNGCNCRATEQHHITVCYGFYTCIFFPNIKSIQGEFLKVKATAIKTVSAGDTDLLQQLKYLEIDSNRELKTIEKFAFKNLSNLEHLSISYNIKLWRLDESSFVGLNSLTNLTMIGNGFMAIADATRAIHPASLPVLKVLDLSENYFPTVSENDFRPMTGSSLVELKLELCQIDYIHPKSFSPLINLRDLRIGENNLNASAIGYMLLQMKSGKVNIRLLDLTRMGFRKSPPKNLMEIIANTTVKKLILADNQFEMISNDTFPKMKNLELLDMRQVLMIYIDQHAITSEKFPNLQVLVLCGNILPGILFPLSKRLVHIDLSHNTGNIISPGTLNLAPGVFHNMSNMTLLNLSFNRIVTIYNFTFDGLTELKYLSLKNASLFRIEPYSFMHLPHLKMLSLENNPYLQHNQVINKETFVGLNELSLLIMSNCGLQTFEQNFFTIFPNLTHLILKNNKIKSMTPDLLVPLKQLQRLDLSNNIIVSWMIPLFKTSRAPIRYLGLHNNKIARFTTSMLEDIQYVLNHESNATEVSLHGNVFTCDCYTMYVAHSWIEANENNVLKERFFQESQFTCSAPAEWENKRVATYLQSYQDLHCSTYGMKLAIVVYTVVTIILILIIVSVVITGYAYRFYIRYWIFLAKLAIGRRHMTKTVKEFSKKTTFTYDAFVSYSSEDREFVIDMINVLENSAPFFKLCVYERDFQLGSYISEAIHSSINDSKHIVLVVSDSFAKSQWCRWETQLAEYHRLFLDGSYNYDPLIVLRIGEVKTKNMTPTLKYLLKTKIYLNWVKDDKAKAEEFWNKLRCVLGKSKIEKI